MRARRTSEYSMHNPPAIALPIQAGRFAQRFALGVGLFTLAVLAPLGLQTSGLIWGGLLALTVVTQLWAWRQNGRAPQGVLAWTGAHWTWSAWPQHDACRATMVVDLAWCSVLQVRQAGQAPLWIVLDAASRRDPRWDAMRRALVAARPSAP